MLDSHYIIESERLFFRNFEEDDARELYNLNKDKQVMQFAGDPPFKSENEADEWLIESRSLNLRPVE